MEDKFPEKIVFNNGKGRVDLMNSPRRLLAVLAVSALAVTFMPQAQAASATANGACKKAGLTAKAASGAKLVCTKSGSKLIWKAVAVKAAAPAPAPAAPAAPKITTPWQVEIVGDVTGGSSGLGAPYVDGISTYFDNVNATGGIQGRQIDYNVVDTGSDNTKSQAVIRDAISKKPVAIFGATGSTTLGAYFPLLEAAELPFISGNSLGKKNYPWFYSAVMTTEQLSTSLTSAALAIAGKTGVKGKKIAIVGIDSPATHITLEALKGKLEKLGASVMDVEYNLPAAPPFDAQAVKIVTGSPNLVIMQLGAAGTVVAAKAIKNAGYNGQFVIQYGGADDVSIASINNQKATFLRPYTYATPGSEMYKLALKYGNAGTISNEGWARGWILAGMFAAGLKKCTATCDAKDLEAAMDSLGNFSMPGGISAENGFFLSKDVHTPLSEVSLWSFDGSRTVQVVDGIKIGPPGYPTS
ncbi:MAG: ABC transporter substrate-binding protein [Actinobacteria bacterium]|uniref:Unannotated protein n=1 Tax=freshwater metagenome TaxID=449393 RepID=A0A6J6VSQ7_9ZZZZ|nr:ABC transporter substrate-binding protein [Actinomycetota bacterium]